MRRLVPLALVVPVLSACGWSPFSIWTRPATPIFHRCTVKTSYGLQSPCVSAPVRRRAMVATGGGALTDNSSDSYIAVGSLTVSATEREVEFFLPPGYSAITNLQAYITTAPGGGASWTLTVSKNGSGTALECSISGAAHSCRDSSIVAVVSGDKIDLDVTPFRSPALATITWSASLLP